MAQRMLIYQNAFLGYFEKRAHMSVVSVCIFVSLYLCMLGCLLQEPIKLKVL